MAIVEVRGLVEEQTAVFDRAVVRVWDDLGVHVATFRQLRPVVEPADGGFRIAVHGEGETPVVLGFGVSQEENFDWNYG